MEQKCPACGKVNEIPEPSAWKWRSGTAYCCNAECKEWQMTKLAMARKAVKMIAQGATEEAVRLILAKEFGEEKTDDFLSSKHGKGFFDAKKPEEPETPQEPEHELPEPVPEQPKETNQPERQPITVPLDTDLFNFDEISFSGKTRHQTEYNLDLMNQDVDVFIETESADRAELETIIKELTSILKMMK